MDDYRMTTTDRIKQVNWLREIAGNIRAGGVGDEGTPEEQVAFFMQDNDLPEWFDDHDCVLLTEFVCD